MVEQTTVIAEGTLVKGRIEGSEDVVIRGRLEGEAKLSGSLLVERTGQASATVEARHVIIAGTLVGDVTASELIEVTASGRSVGDLMAPRVIIADGAGVRGRIEMIGDVQESGRAGERRTSRRTTQASGNTAGWRTSAIATHPPERTVSEKNETDWPFGTRSARSENAEPWWKRQSERSETPNSSGATTSEREGARSHSASARAESDED